MEAFPEMFEVIRDLFFRPSDGGGDFLCRTRTFFQEGADLMPYGLRIPRLLARKIPLVLHAVSYAAPGTSTVAIVPRSDHLTLSR